MAGAETQSTESTSQGTNTSNQSGSGSGSGSGSSGGTPVLTADDLAKQTAADVATVPLTLSDQIAANYAALSAILGPSDTTGGGAYPVPVPVAAPAKSSATIWIVLAAAGIAVWFIFFRKKGKENGE
jgi:hypothetical protein